MTDKVGMSQWNVGSIRRFFGVLLTLWVLVITNLGCTLSADIADLSSQKNDQNIIQKKVFFDTTTLNITEGSAAIVSVQLSDRLETDLEVKLSVMGNSSILAPVLSQVIIPAGSLSVPLTLQTIDDLNFNGKQVVQILLSSVDSTLVAEPNSLTLNIDDNDLPSVTFLTSSQTVSENIGAVAVTAQLNAVSANPVSVPLILSGSATQGAGADYTISAGTIMIPAGQTQGITTVTIIDDTVNESSETIVLTMGTAVNAAVVSPSIFTLTVSNDDIGTYSISGVTGGTDVTADAFLVGGLYSTLNWAASAGASSYDVTIYANDGTTVVCPTQTTTNTSFSFSSCLLTAGTHYKATVLAHDGSLSQPASNNPFPFYTNQAPVANNDGPVRIMKNSSAITLEVVTASDNATRGTSADSDPDVGDTFSIASVTQGVSGGSVSNTSTSVTYTVPNSTFIGVDTFTYTLSDNHGATATATVTIHVMDTYTWTGKVSANWNVNGNWCGTITNNECNGTTGFPNSTATTSMTAIFNGTCTAAGHSCNSTINVATQAYGIFLGAGYTGTVTQGAGNTLALGAAGFAQIMGVFVGGNSNITITGNAVLAGGDFTSTSATLAVRSWSLSNLVTFTANGGTLNITYASSVALVSPANVQYNNVHFNFSSGSTLSGTMDIRGTLSTASAAHLNGGTIKSYGNILMNGWSGGTTVLEIVGTSNQTVNCAGAVNYHFPNFVINSSGGTVSFGGTCGFRHDFTYIAGNLDVTGTTFEFYSPGLQTINANNVQLNNVTFSYYHKSIVGTMKVMGTLNLMTQSWGVNGGTIEAYGDVNLLSGTSSTTSVKVMGSSNQTITGVAAYSFPNMEIASTGGNVTLSGAINFTSVTFRYTSGTIVSSGANVKFVSASVFPNSITLDSVSFDGWDSHTSFNNQTMNVSTILYFGVDPVNFPHFDSGTVNLSGDLVMGAQARGGTGLIRLVGSSDQTILGSVTSALASKIEVASTGGTVVVSGDFGCVDQFKVSSGTMSYAGSTIRILNSTAGIVSSGAQHFNNLHLDGWSRTFDLGGQTLYVDGSFKLGSPSNYTRVNNGTVEVLGNVEIVGLNAATGVLALKGCGQSINVASPSYSGFSAVNVDQPGGCVTAASLGASLPEVSLFTLTNGNFTQSGFNLTATSLNLNGNTLTKSGGVLTVNSSVVGTGALFGGTVAP